jgi:hypothetical protein
MPEVKILVMLSKKPGLSDTEFRRLYEEEHAPLVARLVPHFADYRRNYILRDNLHPDTKDLCPFDVVTEVRFADRDGYDRFMAGLAVPEVDRQLAACEERFLDRSAMAMYVVDEARS